MRYLSVCSGIEAATCAWHPLGWTPAAFAEIERFPSAVLAHHYPETPNLGDMSRYQEWPDDLAPNLLVGGTPCQSFSVAGLRKGLADPRGNLMLTFGAIAQRYRPEWLVWENVPGVLSSNGGRDFGTFLGMLGELGYGFAYRVLDAQFFGVAQRRRRVFVVGHLGDWRRAAAVLFDTESLRGNPAPRREAREGAAPDVAGCLATGGGGRAFPGTSAQDAGGGYLIPSTGHVSHCLNAGGMGRQDYETETLIAHTLKGEGFDASEDGTGRGTPLVPVAFSCKDHGADAGGISPTLRSMNHDGSHANGGGQVAVAYAQNQRDEVRTMEVAGALAVEPEAKQQTYLLTTENDHACTYQADAASVLRTLRDRLGAEAVAEWGSRILDSLQSPEVLRAWLHGQSIRCASSDFQSFVDDSALPREEGVPARAMRDVWENGPDGRSSQGRGLAKQLAHQLGKALPELPSASASQQPSMAVRRLTPKECERLMGFPDDYTAIPWRKKGADECPDGPRYKALGNSMAVPVMAWIGQRIAAVAEQAGSQPVALEAA